MAFAASRQVSGPTLAQAPECGPEFGFGPGFGFGFGSVSVPDVVLGSDFVSVSCICVLC